MKNPTKKPRLCGLCLFPLPADVSALREPAVLRQRIVDLEPGDWSKSWPDDTPEISGSLCELKMRAKPIIIKISSERGCGGCTAILETLENCIQRQRGRLLIDQACLDDKLQLEWTISQLDSRRNKLGISFEAANNETALPTLVFGYHDHDASLSLHPAAQKLSPVAQEYTGSTASLSRFKQNLQECISTHESCKLVDSSLPYRVLELSQNIKKQKSVRLVEQVKTNAHYVCLSHRWGPSTPNFKTTKRNISSHQESIPWETIPKTFQDAVEVTLFLGVKYLWIDALCIIQDDEDDWRTQAAEMCNIYQGAYVTLAATASHDSTEGFFTTTPSDVIIPNHNPDYQNLFVRRVYRGPPCLDKGDMYGQFPLLGRGWVFQERLLSPRFAQFDQEIIIECPQKKESIAAAAWDKRRHLRALTNGSAIFEHWYYLVTSFAHLKLTYHSDTLPALAGIAKQYGTAHKSVLGRYLAGLWENSLLNDLLWFVPDLAAEAKRPDKCSAPTWSWASTPCRPRLSSYSQKKEDLTIVSCSTVLAGPDAYGPVKSGKLIVKGYLVEGTWKWCRSRALENQEPRRWVGFRNHTHSQGPVHYEDAISDAFFHEFWPDYDISAPGGEGYVAQHSQLVYCLNTGYATPYHALCLILRAVNREEGIFERVGLMNKTKMEVVQSWYPRGVEQETITII